MKRKRTWSGGSDDLMRKRRKESDIEEEDIKENIDEEIEDVYIDQEENNEN